jgi:hypothetical protein
LLSEGYGAFAFDSSGAELGKAMLSRFAPVLSASLLEFEASTFVSAFSSNVAGSFVLPIS